LAPKENGKKTLMRTALPIIKNASLITFTLEDSHATGSSGDRYADERLAKKTMLA
jgi:hypothetical protein